MFVHSLFLEKKLNMFLEMMIELMFFLILLVLNLNLSLYMLCILDDCINDLILLFLKKMFLFLMLLKDLVILFGIMLIKILLLNHLRLKLTFFFMF